MKFGVHFNSMQDKLDLLCNLISSASLSTQVLFSHLSSEHIPIPVTILKKVLDENELPFESHIRETALDLITQQETLVSALIFSTFQILLFPNNPIFQSEIATYELLRTKYSLWEEEHYKTLDEIPWILKSICNDLINENVCSKHFLHMEILWTMKRFSVALNYRLGENYHSIINSALKFLAPKRHSDPGVFAMVGTQVVFTPIFRKLQSDTRASMSGSRSPDDQENKLKHEYHQNIRISR